MFKQSDFMARCKARGLDEATTARALTAVAALEQAAAGPGGSLADATQSAVEHHVARLVETGLADEATLMAMARYFAVIKNEQLAIRLLAYLLPVGVLPAMAGRLRDLEGDAVADRVLTGLAFPPTGAAPEAYPAATTGFIEALVRELGAERAERVLDWNVHGIPVSAFAPERERLLALESVDAWLRDYHERQVAELARHAADGSLWYEQRISDAVVDFVRSHPEIQGGVRVGDTIFVTKIPYDPDRYLQETDPLEKRRLACHCPLAASSITETGAGVPAAWCACSAGYTKFLFDVAFGEPTKATVVSSVLAGDPICRFAIRIPASALQAQVDGASASGYR